MCKLAGPGTVCFVFVEARDRAERATDAKAEATIYAELDENGVSGRHTLDARDTASWKRVRRTQNGAIKRVAL